MNKEESEIAFKAVIGKLKELCNVAEVKIVGTATMIHKSKNQSFTFHFNYPDEPKNP
jgi:hypothetical protein